MRRVRYGSPLLLVLGTGAALSACGAGNLERGGLTQGFASTPINDGAAADTATSATFISSGQAPRGGPSGGEGNGANNPVRSVPDIIDGPPQPCACITAASAGTVLSIGEGCARVQVTEVYDPSAMFEAGDVLGGIFELACRPGLPVAAGAQV